MPSLTGTRKHDATHTLAQRYRQVRAFSERIARPLSAEDCMVQSMPDVSPTRWHLAHTTWFFETFVLGRQAGYRVFDEQFCYLFNSYYNAVGPQFPRLHRGLISRPGLERTREYRRHVDGEMDKWFRSNELTDEERHVVEVGLNHEQQHQELMLTDIKHVLSCNPLFPVYEPAPLAPTAPPAVDRIRIDEGLYEIGHDGEGFCFDNECPRHQVFLPESQIDGALVTCGEFLEFIEDGGYVRPGHWLSAGWATVQEQRWQAPLYWHRQGDQWMVFTLAGLRPLERDWPLCHVSYFEADAFARWAGARLPTEFEWETAAAQVGAGGGQFADGLFNDDLAIHPTGGAQREPEISQLAGGVWQWTSSSYAAWPGYCPPEGALGEYNGKFMCNQYVLRGGSVATSSDHIRITYRNFFPPDARWQFSGLRLAH